MSGDRVAAIIPTLDEQGAIGPTIAKLPRDLVDHIIVVDGGSRDGTIAEAEANGAIVLREGRRGYGRACASGAARARALGADIALFLDGDGSDAGELAELLIAPIRANTADLVLAHRSAKGRDTGSMGPHQVAAGHVIGLAVGALTGTRYRDMCAFRAIRIDRLAALDMTEMTYGWNLEMQVRAATACLRIREIEMPYHSRVDGKSKVAGNLSGTIRTSARLLRVLARTAIRSRRSAGSVSAH